MVHRSIAGVAAILLLTASVSVAQPRKPSGWGATVVLGPLLLAHGGLSARCNPMAAERAEWGPNRIEKFLRLTDSQRATLDDVRTAAINAADLKAGMCPAELPRNSADRLAFAAKRLEALQKVAVALMPRFEAFYASLSAEQKAQLDAGPRRWSLR